MAGLKSNNRMSQSARSNAELAGKWVVKVVLLITIVYVLSTKPAWLPVLLKELTEGTEQSAMKLQLHVIHVADRRYCKALDKTVPWSTYLKTAFQTCCCCLRS